mgnify:CR=1 FL=1
MSKVVGIGACVMDTLITVPSFPKEDTKVKAISSKVAGGGPTATGLVAVSKLGVSAGYIGVLAQDSGGNFLLEDFNKYGSNFTFTIIDEISNSSEASKEYQWMKQFKSFIRGVGYNYKDYAVKDTCIVYHTDSIVDEIYQLLLKTRDIDLLDFILSLLKKSN